MSAEREQVRRIDRYELHAEIARGGMARVHLGRLIGPVGFSRTVAIKSLHPAYANDAEVVRMFIDEARLSSCIRHPNVVPTLDVLAMDGELFLVMEYVRGASLAKLIESAKSQKVLPPVPVVVSMMIGALSGLHAAHEALGEDGAALDIVHRDVSPQNILVGEDGVARVLDFGIAKAVSRMQATTDGQIKGKLAYMSPEQISGSEIDRRSDVFSASVVFWELLTGKKLFGQGEPGATTYAVLNREIEPPSSLNPAVPEALDAIVMRGLSRDREARPKTARELAVALEGLKLSATANSVSEFVYAMAKEDIERGAELISAVEGTGTQPVRRIAPTKDARLSSSEPLLLHAVPDDARRDATAEDVALTTPVPGSATPSSAPPTAAKKRRRNLAIGALAFLSFPLATWGALHLSASRAVPDDSAASNGGSSQTGTAASALPVSATDPNPTDIGITPTPSAAATDSVATMLPTNAASTASLAANAKGKVRVGSHRPKVIPAKSGTPNDCRVFNADGTFGYRKDCLK